MLSGIAKRFSIGPSTPFLATSVPILVFLGLSFLELGPKHATDRRQTKASLNVSALWGRGIKIAVRYIQNNCRTLRGVSAEPSTRSHVSEFVRKTAEPRWISFLAPVMYDCIFQPWIFSVPSTSSLALN